MKFEISIEKRHFYLFAALFLLVAGALAVSSADLPLSIAVHPLGSIVKAAADRSSVDSDGDGIIDEAEKALFVDAQQVCIGGDCRTAWPQPEPQLWTASGNDISYTSGNVGIGTASPSAKLDVNGNIGLSGNLHAGGDISGDSLCLEDDCVSTWNDVRAQKCTTWSFDASSKTSGYRYFKFTLPYMCKQPDQGGRGCFWQMHNVRNDGYPYSRHGYFYIQHQGSYKYMQVEWFDSVLHHYDIFDLSNTEVLNSGHDGCRVFDNYYDGIWRSTTWEEFGVRVYPGYKCYLTVCELQESTTIQPGVVTYE